jgi:hypothetical protein
MRFEKFPKGILRAAFWNVSNVYLHPGYTRSTRDGAVE